MFKTQEPHYPTSCGLKCHHPEISISTPLRPLYPVSSPRTPYPAACSLQLTHSSAGRGPCHRSTPPRFEPPLFDESGAQTNASSFKLVTDIREWPFGTDPPKVFACPLLAIQSDADRVWPVGLLERWGELAGAGFKPIHISGVPHYKLVNSKAVWVEVVKELAAAAMAHSQSIEVASDDF